MVRASRSIVYSAKAYVVRIIPVKRVTEATLVRRAAADRDENRDHHGSFGEPLPASLI
jgi:hypothetical protein